MYILNIKRHKVLNKSRTIRNFHYFQKIWTTTISSARPMQTAVLALMASPKSTFDNIPKTTIPTLNPISLVGQSSPSDQLIKCFVASMNIQVIGIPIRITQILCSCKNWYLTVPWTWKKTSACPNMLSSIPINRFIFLFFLVCSLLSLFWTCIPEAANRLARSSLA